MELMSHLNKCKGPEDLGMFDMQGEQAGGQTKGRGVRMEAEEAGILGS